MKPLWVFGLAVLVGALGWWVLQVRRYLIDRRERRAARERRLWVKQNREVTEREIAAMLKSATARIAKAKREEWVVPELRVK